MSKKSSKKENADTAKRTEFRRSAARDKVSNKQHS